MKRIDFLFIIILWACSSNNRQEILLSSIKNIENDKIFPLLKNTSSFLRGNQYYIFFDSSKTYIIDLDGKMIKGNISSLSSKDFKLKKIYSFLLKNKINKMDCYFSKSRDCEFKLNERLILVKNPSLNYIKSMENSKYNTSLKLIEKDWFFYEEK